MHRILLSLLLLASQASTADQPALRFSVSESWSMPLAEIDEHQLTAGILFDIMNQVARQVGRPAEFHVMPRLRIQSALENAEVDVRCYISEAWITPLKGDFRWSQPILIQRDLLLASPLTVGPYPDQFDNEVVGTVLGYNYPALQHLFDRHNLVREDARNQEHVLRKLAAGRYNYAVSNELEMIWINRELPAAHRFKVVSVINEQPVACVVRNDPALPVRQILDSLQKMAESGEIQQIVKRYTSLPDA